MHFIVFPEELATISSNAFNSTKGDYNVNLPQQVRIEGGAFNSAVIRHVYIPSDVTLENGVFSNSHVKTAEFENGRTIIPVSSFSACFSPYPSPAPAVSAFPPLSAALALRARFSSR